MKRCYRLALALNRLARRISHKEVQTSVKQLLQCSTNILTVRSSFFLSLIEQRVRFQGVNGPLQGRMKVLTADLAAAGQFPSDYESNLESDWVRRSRSGNENVFDQEELSLGVSKQMNEVSSLLSQSLNIHLNLEQQFTMNTSNIFMSIQTLNIESLRGIEIPSIGEARLRLPSSSWNLSLLDSPQTGALKVRSLSSLI